MGWTHRNFLGDLRKVQLELPQARVLTLLETLPINQREVIRLRDVEGLSSTEVCNILSLSDANQRVLLHRARAKVRAGLERIFQGEGRP